MDINQTLDDLRFSSSRLRELFVGCGGSLLEIWGLAGGFRSDGPPTLRLYHSAGFCTLVTNDFSLPITEVDDWFRSKIKVLRKLYRSESSLEPVDNFGLLFKAVDVAIEVMLIVIIVRYGGLVRALHVASNVKLKGLAARAKIQRGSRWSHWILLHQLLLLRCDGLLLIWVEVVAKWRHWRNISNAH